MASSWVLSGVLLGSSAGFAPGPLTALLLGETLRHGRTAGLRLACVPLVSDLPVILLSLLVLRSLTTVGSALGAVSVAGGLFVGWLALEGARAQPPAATRPHDGAVPFGRGVITNLLNPHPYLFWITVGAPQMRAAGGLGLAFVIPFYLGLVGAKAGMAVAAGRLRGRLGGRAYRLISLALALALGVLALSLLRDGVRLLTT